LDFAPLEADDLRSLRSRLARDNAWTLAYAARVMAEYERFLLLAARVSHRVVPSDAVDQAWHQHVLHTKEYRVFCERVFGRPLDHAPSRGRSDDAGHHIDYERTLASYTDQYGEPPPKDIWPSCQQRFDAAARWARVDISEHWVLRQPRAVRWFVAWQRAREESVRSAGPRASLLIASTFAFGLVPVPLSTPGAADTWTGPQYLLFHLLLWALTLAAAFELRARARRVPVGATVPELDAYEVAQLGRGPRAAVNSAVATLLARGNLTEGAERGRLHAVRSPPEHAHALELGVHAMIARIKAGQGIAKLRAHSEALTRSIAERLAQRGLTAPRWSAAFAFALVAPVVGCARLVSRVGSGRPIGFLVALTAIGFLVALVGFAGRRAPSSLGALTLERLRERHAALATRAPAATLAADGTLPLVVGLFGFGVVSELPAAHAFADVLAHDVRDKNTGGGGCGAGCGAGCGGGGGCGGGCGGCGGGQ
jgi:uncharacterized protein (TIGR04222 family)